MDPVKVSAQFAAFVWFVNQGKEKPQDENPPAEREASRFAKEHWHQFLPLAHEGLGRLLLKIAEPRRRHKRASRELAVVG